MGCGRCCVIAERMEVEPTDWHSRCAEVRASGATMLDLLAAVDDADAGCIRVVAHLLDVAARHHLFVWTAVERSEPSLSSLVDLYPGAGWHEREIHEMFGVSFPGNPDQRPLLTTGDMRHPLRRTTALPARLDTPWPGAVEPSDRAATGRAAARPRSRPGPPGIPEQWLR